MKDMVSFPYPSHGEITMATKATWKRRIQSVLSDNSKGIYSDESWAQVHNIWKAIRAMGCDLVINSANYQQNHEGTPVSKTWLYTIEIEGFSFDGILTAHGAGSVKDPLDKYDISAYITK